MEKRIVVYTAIVSVVGAFLACGGGDGRPNGNYQANVQDGSSDIGCSSEFLAFINAASNGGGSVTTFDFTLEPEGKNSLTFNWTSKDLEMTLSEAAKEKTWAGSIVGNVTYSGCQLSEAFSLSITENDDKTLSISLLDEWANVPLTSACPFFTDSCQNSFEVSASKI